MRIRRSAAAQEAKGGVRVSSNLVPRRAGDQDGITGADVSGFAIDIHQAMPFEDEIELLTHFVIVPLGGGASGDGGFREALHFHRGIGAVQNAADGGAILRGERGLSGELVDGHGVCGIDSPVRERRKENGG
jgi:hypothetical protein